MVILLTTLYACSHADDPVTGTWKLPGEDITADFSKEGTVTLSISGTTISGAYRRDNENNLLVDMGNGEQRIMLSEQGNELRLSDQQNDTDIFLRLETAQNVDKAEELFTRGYQADQCDSSIVFYSDAIMLLEGIPSESEHLARAYNNRGICHEKNDETDEAMNDYNKAIETDPRLEIAYGNRAWLYDKLGNRPAAIVDYKRAAELGYIPARQWLSEQGIGTETGK